MIFNVLKTGISVVSFLPAFLSYVLRVFNNPAARSAHGLQRFSPRLRLRFISDNASLLALYICATTQGPVPLH